MTGAIVIKGVLHGKTIELEREPGLPDGRAVTVTVELADLAMQAPAGDGLRRSAGAWSDDVAGLDQYLEWNRQQRKQTRAGFEP